MTHASSTIAERHHDLFSGSISDRPFSVTSRDRPSGARPLQRGGLDAAISQDATHHR